MYVIVCRKLLKSVKCIFSLLVLFKTDTENVFFKYFKILLSLTITFLETI